MPQISVPSYVSCCAACKACQTDRSPRAGKRLSFCSSSRSQNPPVFVRAGEVPRLSKGGER